MSTATVDILAFGAHPDDVEIGMGGTMAKHAAAGFRMGICDLTRAEMSSNGSPELREAEAETASEALGLTVRSNLRLPDRGLTGSPDQLEAIVRELRLRRPRIVFAPFWNDRHPDHNSCSRLIEEAVFNAKLRRYLPELQPVNVEQLYYYFINDVEQVSLTVDITEHYGQKLKALEAYRSQFDPAAEGSDRVRTPLTDSYIQNVEARDRLLGARKQCGYAEGFALKRPAMLPLFL